LVFATLEKLIKVRENEANNFRIRFIILDYCL
jgi:hypothetical protein